LPREPERRQGGETLARRLLVLALDPFTPHGHVTG
jgi:hypothetical protein